MEAVSLTRHVHLMTEMLALSQVDGDPGTDIKASKVENWRGIPSLQEALGLLLVFTIFDRL